MSSGAEAGGVALIKYFGLPVVIGALAGAMGFVVLWPKSTKEGVARIASSIVCSGLFGPALVVAAYHQFPWVFEGAAAMAVAMSLPVDQVYMTLAAPCFAIAGLPAWWILGFAVRWLENHRGQDMAQVLKDVSKAWKGARP